jgi:hypothetical protein
LNSIVVVGIEAGKRIETRIRASRELNEERREHVAKSLLVGVSKVEIEIGDGGISGVAQLHDILNNRSTGRPGKFLRAGSDRGGRTRVCSSLSLLFDWKQSKHAAQGIRA